MSGIELFTIGKIAITLADVGTALAVVGSVVGAAGAVRQGQATQASLDFQAGVQRQQAERERQEAASREEDFRRDQSRLLARRRAALGGTGVEPASGSPLLVSEDFAGETEFEALKIRAGGELRATRLEQSAGLLRFQGRGARSAGFLRGGALLLSGAGTAFGRRA